MSITVLELRAKQRQELERARMAIVRPVIQRLERERVSATQIGRLLGYTGVRMHRILTGQADAPAGFMIAAQEAIEQITRERQQAQEA